MGSRASVVIKTYGKVNEFNNASTDVINFLMKREEIDDTQYLNWVSEDYNTIEVDISQIRSLIDKLKQEYPKDRDNIYIDNSRLTINEFIESFENLIADNNRLLNECKFDAATINVYKDNLTIEWN